MFWALWKPQLCFIYCILEYIRKNKDTLTVKEWRVIFFQILSALSVIQNKYPGFRHNDLKANNILIQKIIKGNT